jgi:hypothetical protein
MMFGETVTVYCENRTEHTDTVRTSQGTHYVSVTEPNRLMLFGETVAVCESHTEHTDTLCRQNGRAMHAKAVVSTKLQTETANGSYEQNLNHGCCQFNLATSRH